MLWASYSIFLTPIKSMFSCVCLLDIKNDIRIDKDKFEVYGVNIMLKKYKMGFDIWGLIVFLIIMIPNFIWFAIPTLMTYLEQSQLP